MARGRRRWLARFGAVAVLAIATLLSAEPVVLAEPTPAAPSQVRVTFRSTMAAISWDGGLPATALVELSEAPDFAVARRVDVTESIALFTGLKPATRYYVRVYPRSTDGSVGAPTPPQDFTTPEQQYPAAAPSVTLSPLTTTSLEATWNAVTMAASYVVQTSTDADFSEPTSLTVTDPAAILDGLVGKTTYYVRVRALGGDGTLLSDWSTAASAATPESLPLRVASWNVLCENCSKGKASWAKRRGPLVDYIKEQDPDVLGVQEASQGRIPGGRTQYNDLLIRLGKPYAITDAARSASLAVRIIYNSDRVKLLDKGSTYLPRGPSKRAATWAIFEQRSTGKKFFYLSTHLEPTNDKKGSNKHYNVRKRQARAVVDVIRKNNPDGLPVIAVGDFNSTKWDDPSNAPYDIMQAAGYRDPLGNAYESRGRAPGAFVENRINTSYASFNMYLRKARRSPGDVNGSNPDYIFVSPMRVSEYETVVKVDSAGRWRGVIPSDHNMIRATVWLP